MALIIAPSMPAVRRHATVAAVQELGPGLGRIDLDAEHLGRDVRPGQFAMVEAVGRADCVLLRPYSYFAASDHRAAFLVKDIGKGTHALLHARVGDTAVILGPLGSSFPGDAEATWAVAGGVGLAPFGGCGANVRVLFGARTATDTGFARAVAELGLDVDVATDDGTEGFHGSVVDLLEHKLQAARPPRLFCCGPTRMMQAVVQVAYRHALPCWVSLEERMGCGIGVCRGCAHADASGGLRCICVDGPVYDARAIFTPSQVER